MTARTYNGHPSYNAWNVSLWINNDEGLYNMVRDRLLFGRNRRYSKLDVAKSIVAELEEVGVTKTPDGVRYTATNVMRAMEGM